MKIENHVNYSMVPVENINTETLLCRFSTGRYNNFCAILSSFNETELPRRLCMLSPHIFLSLKETFFSGKRFPIQTVTVRSPTHLKFIPHTSERGNRRTLGPQKQHFACPFSQQPLTLWRVPGLILTKGKTIRLWTQNEGVI